MIMRRSKSIIRRPNLQAQADHVDAWLMSYADLITLLFMLFVIMVSVMVPRQLQPRAFAKSPEDRPFMSEHYGPLALGTPFDNAFHSLTGIITSEHADQHMAVQKNTEGMWVELSSMQFFHYGTADVPQDQLPMLKTVARIIRAEAPANANIEIEGYTDDAPLQGSPFANNWELSAMRAARMVSLLVDQGISPQRLRAVNYAANRPAVPNIDAAGKPIPQNRNYNQRIMIRVELPRSQSAR